MFQNTAMKRILIPAILSLISITNVKAQTTTPSTSLAKSVGLYVFPAKNQTADQQSKDEGECYKWAIQQSGYDPINPTKVTAAPVDKGADGTAVVGAAKGAAAGAAIGAIAGDAGKGAAIGAVAGGLGGRRAKKGNEAKQEQKNEQAAAQQNTDMLNSFKKAYSVCLEGKGYTVK